MGQGAGDAAAKGLGGGDALFTAVPARPGGQDFECQSCDDSYDSWNGGTVMYCMIH